MMPISLGVQQPWSHWAQDRTCTKKRLGTALRELKKKKGGHKLADGKTIGGAGRLTVPLMDSMQNYYGDAIRRNKGNVDGMVRAVQSTLLHLNSTDAQPRHHLCPSGADSWCGWQRTKANKERYHHTKAPIPPAIVTLLEPIYARLGSRALLEKCKAGYTQNANVGLHNIVWRFCPKDKFMGKSGVEIACALAVSNFNDRALSLSAIAKRFGFNLSSNSRRVLKARDLKRLQSTSIRLQGMLKF